LEVDRFAKHSSSKVRRSFFSGGGKPLEIQLPAVKRNFWRNLIVAKNNKGMRNESSAKAGSSGKAGKIKAGGRSTSAKGKKSSPQKRSAAQKPKRPTAAAPLGLDPTDEQIQTRAYFISERRRRFDLPGDANSDWLEAKRQLLSEIGPR
jgi:Protein of unknown function (DUF2934)